MKTALFAYSNDEASTNNHRSLKLKRAFIPPRGLKETWKERAKKSTFACLILV